MGRPTYPDDPLPWDPIVAEKKVRAEGTPTERLIVLGWQIDTRRMIIQLPTEKADLWDHELKEVLDVGNDGWPIGLKRLEALQPGSQH
jgi:hypothetical protein